MSKLVEMSLEAYKLNGSKNSELGSFSSVKALNNEEKLAENESVDCVEKYHANITNLPAELFQHILKYLSFDNIAKVRLVSQHFNNMCCSLLNSEFNRLRIVVQQKFVSLKAQMPRRESSRRKHPLARESDIIETLYMRLTLLNMTFGKHIERKYCCFFAGEILDEIYKILCYVENTPCLSRAYKVTDELFDLSTMAMEYFKENIEPGLPEVTYFASDVFEYPSFSSSAKAHLSILEETVGNSSRDAPEPPTATSIQVLSKRIKIVKEIAKRNSKEISSIKKSVKTLDQKINSLEEVLHELKRQQKNSEGAILPDSRKMNELMFALNLCKNEIELLTSKLPVPNNLLEDVSSRSSPESVKNAFADSISLGKKSSKSDNEFRENCVSKSSNEKCAKKVSDASLQSQHSCNLRKRKSSVTIVDEDNSRRKKRKVRYTASSLNEAGSSK